MVHSMRGTWQGEHGKPPIVDYRDERLQQQTASMFALDKDAHLSRILLKNINLDNMCYNLT